MMSYLSSDLPHRVAEGIERNYFLHAVWSTMEEMGNGKSGDEKAVNK